MPHFESISIAELKNEPMLPAVSSSFYTAMRVLPATRRQAMFDIYAFCRAVGDIADSHAPTAARRASLGQWRHDIDACYGGNAPPHLLSLHQQIISFGLKCDDFHAVIDGMMMDVNTDIFAPHAITPERYCDRVASAVGRLSVRVFGTLVCVPPLGVRNQSMDPDQLNFPFFDLGSGALEHISEINNR